MTDIRQILSRMKKNLANTKINVPEALPRIHAKVLRRLAADIFRHDFDDVNVAASLYNDVIDLLEAAQAANDKNSKLMLAQIYMSKKYMDDGPQIISRRNNSRAKKLLLELIEDRSYTKVHAPRMMGIMHDIGADSFGYTGRNGYGIMQEAKKYYTIAANRGDILSAKRLGELYLSGKHFDRDINLAIKYYKQASAQGDFKALNVLGDIYLEWALENEMDAFVAFQESASQESPYGLLQMGRMLALGEGTKPDAESAINCFTRYYQLMPNRNPDGRRFIPVEELRRKLKEENVSEPEACASVAQVINRLKNFDDVMAGSNSGLGKKSPLLAYTPRAYQGMTGDDMLQDLSPKP